MPSWAFFIFDCSLKHLIFSNQLDKVTKSFAETKQSEKEKEDNNSKVVETKTSCYKTNSVR